MHDIYTAIIQTGFNKSKRILNLGEEVILFGNNDVEDYLCASKCGIKCYLVGNHLLLHPEYKLNPPVIKMEEVISTIKDNLNND